MSVQSYDEERELQADLTMLRCGDAGCKVSSNSGIDPCLVARQYWESCSDLAEGQTTMYLEGMSKRRRG